MKFLKKYNESVTSSELPDILKLNLEDNPYFDVTDVVTKHFTYDVTDPKGREYKEDYYAVSIIEIFGEDSLLWKQTYDGISAHNLSFIDLKDKMFYINRKLIILLAKKYDFTIKDFYVYVDEDNGRLRNVECRFKLQK